MDSDPHDIGRRHFLRTAGVGAAAIGLAVPSAIAATPAASPAVKRSGAYNILFILVDQERYFRPGELPVGFSLPSH